jgi:ribosome-associated protein
MENLEMIKTMVKALDSKKAVDIRVIKVDKLTALTEYFVICNGTSSTQIKTLADEVEFKLSEQKEEVRHREGYGAGNWILLDYSSVIVHIFHKDMRDFYSLERLWADGESLDINDFLK